MCPPRAGLATLGHNGKNAPLNRPVLRGRQVKHKAEISHTDGALTIPATINIHRGGSKTGRAAPMNDVKAGLSRPDDLTTAVEGG